MNDPQPPPFDPATLPGADAPQHSAPAPTQPQWAAQVIDGYKIYGSADSEVRALDGITVGFEPSRFTAIMGPSGSGKSTLMQCAAGLDRLSQGQVFIGEVDISTLNEKQLTLLRRERIGFVFQQFNLLPTLTAGENITFPLDLAGRKVDQGWMDQVVTTVGLADRLTHKPSELSGGQQQRVAVARALVERPQIIFADEPTGNLDSQSSADILHFLRDAVDSFGQTVVMVTHDPVAATHADRVLFLSDGRLVDELMAPTKDSVLARMGALAG
ncbi:MAG: ABC transporter ATP-binding protein [Microthrixaceae bacterium]